MNKIEIFRQAFLFLSRFHWLHERFLILAKLYVDLDKGFKFSYMPHENGEEELVETVAAIFPNQLTFFDVGANRGTYTQMVFSRCIGVEAHLFEPLQQTFLKCKDNLSQISGITFNQLALFDKETNVEFRVYPEDSSRNGIAGVGEEVNFLSQVQEVKCTTGDAYCFSQEIGRVNFIKIDAEGYDLHVLKGFEELIRAKRIDIIQFEYTVKHSEIKCMLKDYFDLLVPNGYIIGPLRKRGVEFSAYDFTMNNFDQGPNYIACLEKYRKPLELFRG